MPSLKDVLALSPLPSRFETELLVAHILKKSREFVIAHPEYEVEPEQGLKITAVLARRAEHEPVAYITGHKEFYGRDFSVTKDTLIPRPETEILVEEIIQYIDESLPPLSSLDVVDVGTGSGNIIITLESEIERGGTRFFGMDISAAALEVAKKNAVVHHSTGTVEFFESDLLYAYTTRAHEAEHLIIAANLPYLSQETYDAAEKDVREYEPKSALVSTEMGLSHYYRLLQEIKSLGRSPLTTVVFFEIGPEQSSSLSLHIEDQFPEAESSIIQDLSGKDRLIRAII